MNLIYITGVLSLIIQVFTGIFDIYVLTLKFEGPLSFLKNLLWIELFVQIIEGIFYVWLVTRFASIKNITPFRYNDWLFTTPTMLFTYMMYLCYINKYGTETMVNKTDKPKDNDTEYYECINENLPIFLPIAGLNTLMLFFGYMAELKKITPMVGAILGFIPFFIMFYLIYENYAKSTDIGRTTFMYFVSVWGLYGIASVMPYKYKNATYNILDLFAKNFFGIFLAVVLLMSKK
jgi:hypothetical protein